MKNIILLLSLAYFNMPVNQDSEAKKILDRLNATYKTYATLEIHFDLELNYPEREYIRQQGLLIQDRNKYVFKTQDQEIYGDGKAVWLYLKERNEVQINNYEEDEEGLSIVTPKDLLRQYQTGSFEYAVTGKEGDYTLIEFKPVDEDSEYTKFRLTIDARKNTLHKVFAFGKDGSNMSFSIRRLEPNKRYPPETFTFNPAKYPGVFIEDLRID